MVVAVDDPTALDRAVAALQAGGAVVLPTDTVYGLAVLPTLADAVPQLSSLKGRDPAQPIAVLVADVGQAERLIGPFVEPVRSWVDAYWPGPLTIIQRHRGTVEGEVLGAVHGTLGVRCPALLFVRALAARVGPLATTSANRHGQPTATTAGAAAAALTGSVALVVDGGLAGTLASTVVDAADSSAWRVLREGAISEGQLRSAAGDAAR